VKNQDGGEGIEEDLFGCFGGFETSGGGVFGEGLGGTEGEEGVGDGVDVVGLRMESKSVLARSD
jgi:hypothetical protein